MFISYPSVKRIFDIIFSLSILLITSPLLILISFAVKISSKGPVLYRDRRMGQNAQAIWCFKFRTMYSDAKKQLPTLLASNPSLQKEWETYHKLRNDPRITPLGRILRKTSLDEFPQFFNVVFGDLSVVGPRPFPVRFGNPTFQKKAPVILSVKPGITGLWQTSGRSSITLEERLHIDERYVKHRSFLFDLFLIMKTIPAVLSSRGAH
jgi:exopolysaccharide production protein ExoY